MISSQTGAVFFVLFDFGVDALFEVLVNAGQLGPEPLNLQHELPVLPVVLKVLLLQGLAALNVSVLLGLDLGQFLVAVGGIVGVHCSDVPLHFLVEILQHDVFPDGFLREHLLLLDSDHALFDTEALTARIRGVVSEPPVPGCRTLLFWLQLVSFKVLARGQVVSRDLLFVGEHDFHFFLLGVVLHIGHTEGTVGHHATMKDDLGSIREDFLSHLHLTQTQAVTIGVGALSLGVASHDVQLLPVDARKVDFREQKRGAALAHEVQTTPLQSPQAEHVGLKTVGCLFVLSPQDQQLATDYGVRVSVHLRRKTLGFNLGALASMDFMLVRIDFQTLEARNAPQVVQKPIEGFRKAAKYQHFDNAFTLDGNELMILSTLRHLLQKELFPVPCLSRQQIELFRTPCLLRFRTAPVCFLDKLSSMNKEAFQTLQS